MNLSKEQQQVMSGIVEWHKKQNYQWLTVSGNAGTGKTFLLSHLPEFLPDTTRAVYVCYTGKAVSVLYNKLKEANVHNADVSTIHKLLYTPNIKKDEDGFEFIDGWSKNESVPYDLIIIDEASMVGQKLFEDILDLNLPILCVGDDFQLPPIGEKDFSLMNSPNLRLTTIHRQAEGNPIIQISKYIRENLVLPDELNTSTTRELLWYNKNDKKLFNKIPFQNPNIITLCAFNKTRKYMNKYIRGLCGYDGGDMINPGERVVCLKNNDVLHKSHLYYIANGMMATVKKITQTPRKNIKNITMDFDIYEDEFSCVCDTRSFGEIDTKKIQKYIGDPMSKEYARRRKQKSHNCFDHGYTVTCHKSQGSQWPCVIVIDERSQYTTDIDYARWLYTAVTRAEKKLFILRGYC